MKNSYEFRIFLIIRLASVFLVQTYFVPDEYYQSVEVAHNLVFKYGYLTWEWEKGIRSYIPPLFIASVFKVLQVLRVDFPMIVIYAPRILQATLSAFSDVCFYRWAGETKVAIFLSATSWFWFYTASRTLINTIECILTTIALSKFPWPGKVFDDNSTFLWIVAFLFTIRPTSAIIWLPLCFYHLLIQKQSFLKEIYSRYLPIGVLVLTIAIAIDSVAKGFFIITLYEFFKFNVFDDVASFYGVQPWYWYFVSGLPAILGVNSVPFILATYSFLKNRDLYINEFVILLTIMFTTIVYSCLPHKEHRFLLPVLPLANYLISKFLSNSCQKASIFKKHFTVMILTIGNILPILYFGLIHQRGSIDVMRHLQEIAQRGNNNTYFLFLMPCHSTPLYSHLHVNVSTRFLTCLPNFDKQKGYIDEADFFYSNPKDWFRGNYLPEGPLPSHIIIFDTLRPYLNNIFQHLRYKQIQIFHTNVPSTARVGKYLLVYEKVEK